MKISVNVRNDATAYLAPPIFVWDPTTCGVKVRCPGSEHHMHKNQWRDSLAYHFSGPILLRRRLLKCQKVSLVHSFVLSACLHMLQVGCSHYGKSYLVRDEGVSWYPFFHTSRRAFYKPLYDYVITACGNGLAFRQMRMAIEEGQRQEWLRRKCAWQANFRATHTATEAQKVLFGEKVPYPNTFPSFEVRKPCGFPCPPRLCILRISSLCQPVTY